MPTWLKALSFYEYSKTKIIIHVLHKNPRSVVNFNSLSDYKLQFSLARQTDYTNETNSCDVMSIKMSNAVMSVKSQTKETKKDRLLDEV